MSRSAADIRAGEESAVAIKQLAFRANGLRLNCLDYGGEGKPPLLFLHGGSAHAHWWDFVAPAFTDRFHALALDQRGHGESEWPAEWAYGSRHYASDLDQIISNWGLGAPVLVGHSMGGHNVLVYAAEHSHKLRAIATIDSPPDYPEFAVQYLNEVGVKPPRRYQSLDEAVANFKTLPRETLASKEVLEHTARHSYRQLDDGTWTHKIDRRTMKREPIQTWELLPQISCPALVIKVLKSPFPTSDVARKMAARMPRGRFAELDDSYHHAMLDNPRGLIALLKAFLADLG